MKKKRNLLLTALGGMAVLSLSLAFAACGEKEVEDDCKLAFTLVGDEYAVAGLGDYDEGDLVIPSTYKGKPVTSIASGAFKGVSLIGSVVIPDSVEVVGAEAFSTCANLSAVDIAGATKIEASAFAYCGRLRDLTLSEGLQTIGESAFHSCVRLYELTLPDAVTDIGASAFALCENLETVDFSASLATIGEKAFYGCASLKAVEIPDGAPTQIGKEAFTESDGIKYVKLGNAVRSIGERAFYYDIGLKYVECGDSVATIESEAFADCRYMFRFTAGTALSSVGDNAFYRCYILREVYDRSETEIAQSTSLGDYAWHIYGEGGQSRLSETDDGMILYTDGDEVTLITCVVEDYVHLVIPESVDVIGYRAFYNNQYILGITIGDNVKKIEQKAFQNCYMLTSLSIGDGVTEIAKEAFYGSRGLRRLTFGKNVQTVGKNAFYKNFGYSETLAFDRVYFRGTESEWNAIAFDEGNTDLTETATVYFYEENQPTTSGNFWRYVDGKATIWE